MHFSLAWCSSVLLMPDPCLHPNLRNTIFAMIPNDTYLTQYMPLCSALYTVILVIGINIRWTE